MRKVATLLVFLAWFLAPVPAKAYELTCVTVGGFAAAVSEPVFDDMVRYLARGDEERVTRMITRGLLLPLSDGVAVHIESATRGKASFVFANDRRYPPQVLWTFREAVKCR